MLSPDLFSLYGEINMRKLEDMEGIKEGNRNISKAWHVDGTVLHCRFEGKAAARVNEASKEKGLCEHLTHRVCDH